MDQAIVDFIAIGLTKGLLQRMDSIYWTNRLLSLVGKKEVELKQKPSSPLPPLLEVLDQLVEGAVENGTIEEMQSERDILEAEIMDILTPLPSKVNTRFWSLYEEDPKKATDYFYDLSRENNYIKTRSIAKNIAFTKATAFGDLEITINLSKPEKDSRQIAMQRALPSSSYPACMLCMENEGYEGNLNHPGRANHRIIRMNVNDETWGFQYSPYAYYPEHSIFLSAKHRPMLVDQTAYRNLLAIVETLPHYFVGSNAGLPIVGGSILSHDHYQGGRHTFPMEKAEVRYSFDLPAFSTVQAGIVKWPMSVIRLNSLDKEELVQAAAFILNEWEGYSDEDADIVAFSNGEPHNAITPIARRKGAAYEIDLVLRNNRTSTAFPDGIFHPHPKVQHIKKENIGLIEVMGLAILPPRLKPELKEVARYLLDQPNEMKDYHKEWAVMLKESNTVTAENVQEVIKEGVGEVFLEVLKDAGVYKTTEEGKTAFLRFIEKLQKKEG